MSKTENTKKVSLTPEQKANAKQAAFVRVVTPRVNKALTAIRLVGACAGSNYLYTAQQAEHICKTLSDGVKGVVDAYAKKAEKKAEFSL